MKTNEQIKQQPNGNNKTPITQRIASIPRFPSISSSDSSLYSSQIKKYFRCKLTLFVFTLVRTHIAEAPIPFTVGTFSASFFCILKKLIITKNLIGHNEFRILITNFVYLVVLVERFSKSEKTPGDLILVQFSRQK